MPTEPTETNRASLLNTPFAVCSFKTEKMEHAWDCQEFGFSGLTLFSLSSISLNKFSMVYYYYAKLTVSCIQSRCLNCVLTFIAFILFIGTNIRKVLNRIITSHCGSKLDKYKVFREESTIA